MEALYFTEYLEWLSDHLIFADLYFIGLILVAFLITALLNFLGYASREIL